MLIGGSPCTDIAQQPILLVTTHEKLPKKGRVHIEMMAERGIATVSAGSSDVGSDMGAARMIGLSDGAAGIHFSQDFEHGPHLFSLRLEVHKSLAGLL